MLEQLLQQILGGGIPPGANIDEIMASQGGTNPLPYPTTQGAQPQASAPAFGQGGPTPFFNPSSPAPSGMGATEAISKSQAMPGMMQPPQAVPSQGRTGKPEPLGAGFSKLFGSGFGGGRDFFARLGPALMIGSGDPRMMSMGFSQLEKNTKLAAQQRQTAQAYQYFVGQGMSPQEAMMAASNPTILGKAYDRLHKEPAAAPTSVKEFEHAQRGGYTGTYFDFLNRGKEATDGRKPEMELRKEYTARPEFKRFDEIIASYSRVRSAADRSTGAGDLGLIFGFMKMLDPGSVVREGEFANAENAGGVSERWRTLYNSVLRGERLSPQQRAEFVGLAQNLYEQESARLQGLNEQYGGVARQYGIDPSRVIVQPKQFEPWKPPQQAAPQQSQNGEANEGDTVVNRSTGQRLQLRNGQWVPLGDGPGGGGF
jgi:hypothetical protein